MLNRGLRQPLFIFVLALHLIVLSTYTILRYQRSTPTETYSEQVLTEADPFAKPLPPGPLPASLIEKSERLLLNQNYKRFNKQRKSVGRHRGKTFELFKSFLNLRYKLYFTTCTMSTSATKFR